MDKNLSELETIPRLCNRVCSIWGTPELTVYINSLFMDSQDGARKGLPMAVGTELFWLVEINKWRRVLDIQAKQKIGLSEALAKVQKEDSALSGDVWDDPIAGGVKLERRYSDRARSTRPRRRHEENTLFGIIFGAVTSKLGMFVIMALLSLKIMWPTIKVFF